ncbi:hypothetical protein SFC57_16335 [Niallia circulans]|nr:hypothetical protein [Niallia circulans]
MNKEKWLEIEKLLKQCQYDLKVIHNNLITLEKILPASKENVH